jgi:hypothetical protein
MTKLLMMTKLMMTKLGVDNDEVCDNDEVDVDYRGNQPE